MRNYLIKLGFLSLLLLSCEMIPTITLVMDTPTINELSSAPNKENTPSPKSDLLSPNTFGTVDATTLKDKVIFGYQGWFGCPGDGSQVDDWFHWYRGPAAISNLTVDYWPDTSELTEEELCPTGMVDKRGKPLHAFSSYNQLTVLRHFYWMAENGIDGVELQRFATELIDPRYAEFRNKVTENVKFAAETYDRFFISSMMV